MANGFPAIRFQGRLRPSQEDAAEIARRKLARGERLVEQALAEGRVPQGGLHRKEMFL